MIAVSAAMRNTGTITPPASRVASRKATTAVPPTITYWTHVNPTKLDILAHLVYWRLLMVHCAQAGAASLVSTIAAIRNRGYRISIGLKAKLLGKRLSLRSWNWNVTGEWEMPTRTFSCPRLLYGLESSPQLNETCKQK